MRPDRRSVLDAALHRARLSAFDPGEFVGQESFMRAGEILSLAVHAGIGPGVSVLDLCCGVAGPGRLIASELGCRYLGVDESRAAVELARQRTADLPCRFEVRRVPPVPPGPFDVVLLLETMLAFADKEALLHGVASALSPGGRFAFTVEEGRPLAPEEARAMPDADTVWLVPLPDLLRALGRAGLEVRWIEECSRSHGEKAESLIGAFLGDRSAIAARIGSDAVDKLVTAHRLWRDWLGEGRVRKFAVVAERVVPSPHG